MRILHTTASLSPALGILNQMQWEQEAAKNLSLDWRARCFCPKDININSSIVEKSRSFLANNERSFIKRLHNFVKFRAEYYNWLKSLEDDVDIFLLRHYTNDPLQLRFIYNCKKTVFLVHHTMETKELATTERLSTLRVLLEKFWGNKSIKEANCIVGVTPEIIDYERNRISFKEKPSILYPNGVIYKDDTIKDERKDTPEFIFVASYFASWHGLDLLINNIKKSHENFILHLVGKIDYDLHKRAQMDSRIVLHGFLTEQDIRKLSARCWLGLSSFALYRKHMRQACTLKVREYLMMGLPVYAAYEDIFPASFPYFMQGVPAIEKIIDFAKSMALTSREEISASARPFIDKEILLRKFYSDISEVGNAYRKLGQ